MTNDVYQQIYISCCRYILADICSERFAPLPGIAWHMCRNPAVFDSLQSPVNAAILANVAVNLLLHTSACVQHPKHLCTGQEMYSKHWEACGPLFRAACHVR